MIPCFFYIAALFRFSVTAPLMSFIADVREPVIPFIMLPRLSRHGIRPCTYSRHPAMMSCRCPVMMCHTVIPLWRL